MVSIKQMAQEHKPKETQNISEVESISVELDVVEKTFTKSDGEEFTLYVAEIDGVDYRVPVSVLAQLKAMTEEKPDLKTFKVNKNGNGMNTTYTVIPLE